MQAAGGGPAEGKGVDRKAKRRKVALSDSDEEEEGGNDEEEVSFDGDEDEDEVEQSTDESDDQEEATDTKWECSQCTFHNRIRRTSCELCQKPKPSSRLRKEVNV